MFPRTGFRPAFNANTFSPVIAFERAIEGQAYALHAGKRRELAFQLLVEHSNFSNVVARTSRIEMNHITVRGGNTEILVLQVPQRFGEESGSHQQYQRQCSLTDD